jgi:tRNA-splicing ligase RtcB
MNTKELLALGVPADLVGDAVQCVRAAAEAGYFKDHNPRSLLAALLADPAVHVADPHFGALAAAVELHRATVPATPAARNIAFQRWGDEIDPKALDQMRECCELPVAVAAAVMPDAHLGYGLPVGGVLATENAVVPYAVGVDIACRMKLTVFDLPATVLDDAFAPAVDPLIRALEKGTRFGVGQSWDPPQEHTVMDADWNVSPTTKKSKDRAWRQLGTSGSGNHFVEFGLLTLDRPELGLPAGRYVALLSHSGSRGTGAEVCSVYSAIARDKLPRGCERFDKLAWLSMDSEAGREYWAAMNLMGEYASANHAVIHRNVGRLLGAEPLATVENHHNFAWLEVHDGRAVYVHRKGATPAGPGVLGVIPGSMADPAFVVRGKGGAGSLASASHGAGRRMSRTAATKAFQWADWSGEIRRRGVRLLSAGIDEVPGVYKDIRAVMAQQADLVDVVARFDPWIVKMSDDGKAED